MKKFLAGLLACTIMCGTIPYDGYTFIKDSVLTANAVEEYTEGTYENLTYKKYSNYVEIIDCDFSAIDVVIPSEIEGLPVTIIGDDAFWDCDGLTEITIPESVTNIGYAAFCNCDNLATVTISNGVTNIGDCAFYGCYNLTSLIIPDSVISIGDNAFEDCDSLTSVTIPNNVASIGEYAFFYCDSLTSVTIQGVTSIGDYAFTVVKI